MATVEAPHDLPAALDAADDADAVVLVDCLTIWMSNLMLAEADCEVATRELCEAIGRFGASSSSSPTRSASGSCRTTHWRVASATRPVGRTRPSLRLSKRCR